MNPNKWITKFEGLIAPFLNESGIVNGKALTAALKVCMPSILNAVNIPDSDFSLPEFIDETILSLKGLRK